MRRPRVTVLSTGGTIASTPGGKGAAPRLSADELVAAVPQLSEAAEIDAVTVGLLASKELTLDHVTALARDIAKCVDSGVDGVVVTQGTDTLDEVAFAVDRMLDPGTPVVFTAAMRHPGLPGSDGPANLLAAVRVAASAEARGSGVTVVLDDTIHAARFVRKAHTAKVSAFQSPTLGPVGWLCEDRVMIAVQLRPVPPIPVPVETGSSHVGLMTAFLGMGERDFAHVRSAGYAGLVVEGYGGGHVPSAVVEVLDALNQSIPVVIASRTAAGSILRSTYGTPGGDIDLADRGILSAGFLDGPKARVLLNLILANHNGDAARRHFDSIVAAL